MRVAPASLQPTAHLSPFRFAQVVGVRLFAVSVAKLLLLAAVLSGARYTTKSLRDPVL
jgi:hypothetical protein